MNRPDRSRGSLPAAVAALAVAIVWTWHPASSPPTARADIFHLRDGASVEGELIERTDQTVRVRTYKAEVALPARDVVRIEAAPLSWKTYQTIRSTYPDTADGQYALALWCRDRKLDDLAARHFARALELNANHAPTREALGHAHVGGVWLELDKAAPAPAPGGAPPGNGAAEVDPAEAALLAMRQAEQQMLRQIRAEWYRRIQSIRQSYLDSPSKDRNARGTEQLLGIRDPLAVEPMILVLGDGPIEQRRALLTALGELHTSASTLGLLEAALLDEEAELRQLALSRLARREDPRIMAYMLKSLQSEDESVVRNAANALKALECVEAVPALAKALTDKEVRRVRTEEVLSKTRMWFVEETGQLRELVIRRKRSDPFHADYQKITVTVFRTEVQEALIAITGENYGFDTDAWLAWYRRHVTRPAAVRPAVPPGAPPAGP